MPDNPTVAVSETLQLSLVNGTGSVLQVRWSSNDKSVATVSDDGVVTGVRAGAATISARSKLYHALAKIEVQVIGAETPAPPPGDPERSPAPPPADAGSIWISAQEIAALPAAGSAWDALKKDADRDPGVASVADQNSNHDVYTLAQALVCARLRTAPYCEAAQRNVVAAIGTEQGGRWLAVGRNLTAYVIAADVLGLRADENPLSDGSRVQAWIASFLTMKLADNNTGVPVALSPFNSGSNASAQEGAVYAAVAAYLGDRKALERVWNAFRTFTCDAGAPDYERIDLAKGIAFGWAHDDARACAINPRGTSKVVAAGYPGAGTAYRIDGAIINDMRRGGYYQWPPLYTQYPWVGLEGLVPAATILERAGYPAFQSGERAVLRAVDYLWFLRTQTGNASWFDGNRAAEVIQLTNVAYGTSYLMVGPTGAGRTLGYTDWTHPAAIR